ncbi:hypothetical protein BD324DRAFT_679885 [Kockovaella imperatae]|uniref:Uncharacterized protein n=1 Tax=Kockovaella imperatae TaxID=4999 RepID=A0A1Y1UMZ2_9TREE|nr:hypothetical protein BD324DRAFT_679885 [Kockovaella imperatae]ORX39421.1 hypothetical protein BD324DRAFT_679885 [Kockovaella imperatae]
MSSQVKNEPSTPPRRIMGPPPTPISSGSSAKNPIRIKSELPSPPPTPPPSSSLRASQTGPQRATPSRSYSRLASLGPVRRETSISRSRPVTVYHRRPSASPRASRAPSRTVSQEPSALRSGSSSSTVGPESCTSLLLYTQRSPRQGYRASRTRTPASPVPSSRRTARPRSPSSFTLRGASVASTAIESIDLEPELPPNRTYGRDVQTRERRPRDPPPAPAQPSVVIPPALRDTKTEITALLADIQAEHPEREAGQAEILSDLLQASLGEDGSPRVDLMKALQAELDYDACATISNLNSLFTLLEFIVTLVVTNLPAESSKGKNSSGKDAAFMSELHRDIDSLSGNLTRRASRQEASKVLRKLSILSTRKMDERLAELQVSWPKLDIDHLEVWFDRFKSLSEAILNEVHW